MLASTFQGSTARLIFDPRSGIDCLGYRDRQERRDIFAIEVATVRWRLRWAPR
jgi:hypothetical protein